VAAAIVAILPAAVLVLWLLGWYADLGGSPAEGNTRGEIAGTVWTVDRDTSMIHVSVKPFGLGALPYAVTGDTRVLIGDKEGVLEDLREGIARRVSGRAPALGIAPGPAARFVLLLTARA